MYHMYYILYLGSSSSLMGSWVAVLYVASGRFYSWRLRAICNKHIDRFLEEEKLEKTMGFSRSLDMYLGIESTR